MRTTLTLDDDVAEGIDRELRRRAHSSFKEVVNDLLRRGLHVRGETKSAGRFVVRPRALGVRRGVDYDDIGEVLERIEGASHR